MGLGQELSKAICSKNNGEIQELFGRIDAATVNEADSYGGTPLHTASFNNNVEAVAKLLSIPGINVNARSGCGWTPIMCAASNCSVEALEALLDHPAVDLDVGIEHVVAYSYTADLTKKSKCVEMIQETGRQRETGRLEQDQANHANDFSESGNSLEEMRSNVRKVLAEKFARSMFNSGQRSNQ